MGCDALKHWHFKVASRYFNIIVTTII